MKKNNCRRKGQDGKEILPEIQILDPTSEPFFSNRHKQELQHFESAEVLPATKGNAPVDLTTLYQARSSCSAATEGRKLARELVEVWGELQHS